MRPAAPAIKSEVMSDFQRVLDVAEQHLLTLKAAGVRFLSVEPSTLSQLREPPAPPVMNAQENGKNGTHRMDAPVLQSREPLPVVEPQSNGHAEHPSPAPQREENVEMA